jgi:hypothetical protein
LSYSYVPPLLAIATMFSVIAFANADDSWIELFNGKDFTGWVIDGQRIARTRQRQQMKPLWTVEDKTIRTTGSGFGFLRYDKESPTSSCVSTE